MTKGNYLTAAALLTLGVGLITFGATSSAEAVLWGVTFHARLAKAFGLIITLGSLVTFLVIYGSSLPPNQAERRRGATHALRRGEPVRGGWAHHPIDGPARGESRPSASMGRVATGA